MVETKKLKWNNIISMFPYSRIIKTILPGGVKKT